MREAIIIATDRALHRAAEPRFLRSERGFHGRFYCTLQHELEARGLLNDDRVLEMEYQKSGRHGMRLRPDIVLHVPAEDSGASIDENNLAVWALKRCSTADRACEDFDKLDEFFERLRYGLGFFVNIGAADNFAEHYRGKFSSRLRTVAVWREAEVATKWDQGAA